MNDEQRNNKSKEGFWRRIINVFSSAEEPDSPPSEIPDKPTEIPENFEPDLSASSKTQEGDVGGNWDWLNAPVFTVEETANYLKLDVPTVESELEKGNIPGIRIAGQWRINRNELEKLLTLSNSNEADGVPLPPEPIEEPELADLNVTLSTFEQGLLVENPDNRQENPSQTEFEDVPAHKTTPTDGVAESPEDSLPDDLKNDVFDSDTKKSIAEESDQPAHENSAATPQPDFPAPERSVEKSAPNVVASPKDQKNEINNNNPSHSLTKSTNPQNNAPQKPTKKGPKVKSSQAKSKVSKPHNETVTAKIYTSNFITNNGRARLPDRRVVWLDYRYLREKSLTPFPGDIVEFELHHARNRLEGRNIRVTIPQSKIPLSKPTKPSEKDNLEKPLKLAESSHEKGDSEEAVSLKPVISPTPVKSKIVQEHEMIEGQDALLREIFIQDTSQYPYRDIPQSGTDKSQGIYQNAAVARAEGRYEDAIRLFEQALERGGGTQVYTAYFKMLTELRGKQSEARRVIQRGIYQFPSMINFYIMYGHMERRSRNYDRAELIFREGLKHSTHVNLRWGLGQTLVQIGTESSLKEAGEIFSQLDREGRLNKRDGLYQRFKALQRSQRANRAYDFFHSAKLRLGIAGKRDLPQIPQATDIVVEIGDLDFKETFGLSGHFLVRCFQGRPQQIHILELSKFLRALDPQFSLGIQDGRHVILNPTLAFIAVPDVEDVRDQVMNIFSMNNEAIIPLDDAFFENNDDPLASLKKVLGEYLGRRNLYDSTHPVSGRRFFGRERLLLELTDQVKSGQFLGIYGLRKMGKTSLVFQLRDEKLKDDAVAYVDLQASAALEERTCAPLYYELERDLFQRLQSKENPLADLLRLGQFDRYTNIEEEERSKAGIIFGEDMKSLLDALQSGDHGINRLVIVLDELERILPLSGQKPIEGYLEFFGKLRGLAQMYPGFVSSVVVAANASISERGYWEGRDNPVFALYKRVFLPPFNEDESRQMIDTLGRGMSVYWEVDAIKEITAETGGHPFLTRVLCSRIVKEHTARPLTVTAKMVEDQIVPFIVNESDKLEQITELLHTNFPEEENFLEKIALEEVGKDMTEITDESLRHLLGYHLIEADEDGYRITLNLLWRWLRRRAGVR